ncbi:DUF6161 domain-containing protein [Galbibacter sp. EGI 63066]|uniref:DUF6161 domain-containing protein n=1 Tax=Galbibacter sp. EGI 63066 TaxID=2993559 RepID=UPI0022495904|nr:DUF6161 domain-containing protein [Galbibacter sp. EGI 63066]MCX2681461.1 DUF6161 domain-containing protein [Galbibacter sp. EGI 63066]
MTIKELKSAIQNAQSPDWFKSATLSLSFTTIGLAESLESFTSIYLYFQKQKEGWDNLDNIPPTLQNSVNFFINTLNNLDRIVANSETWNENQLVNQWNNISRTVTVNHTKIVYTYDCPQTEFLIKVNIEQPEYNQDVFNFLNALGINQNIAPNTAKSFTAYLMAYEFIQKDHTLITERRNAEKASITRLRNDFNKYLNKSEKHLNEYLDEAKQKGEDYAKAIDETKETKETAYDTWFNAAKDKHDNFISDTEKHRSDLEKTYRELLRLKSPAEFWSKRAIALKRDGKKYMAWLVALVVFAAGLLYFVLGAISNDSISLIFKNVGTAIKWSIVFISFLSLLAYGIKILAKLSFSSFHLARDAEEREQLTYLYLALRKDGNVEDGDRQMVLQALFSRADTGLLKDVSSPSMPGSATNVVEKIMMK